MSDVQTYSSDVAFTPAVKAIQAQKGSRSNYARMERNGGWAPPEQQLPYDKLSEPEKAKDRVFVPE